jgi:zinc transport system ATP-binding protein
MEIDRIDMNAARDPAPVVAIRDLWFAYEGREVLQAVNLEVGPRDFLAMIGPNGGGKTTLLKLILGLIEPARGEIRVLGRAAQDASPFIGYVPQDVHAQSDYPISVIDVVRMGSLTSGRRWRRAPDLGREAALELLQHLGLAAYADRRLGSLSGGQRQRVFIARALAAQPRLLLLDEPTASIDASGQAAFYLLLKELNKDIPIVLVSHDLLAVSTHVKSVACVYRRLHYHPQPEITGDMLKLMYPCDEADVCPVELVAHGLPHRVLDRHADEPKRGTSSERRGA